jgi:multiple sugar transport system ATP-binding protein
MARIELRGVTKRYPDGTEAVTALDLEIPDGEFVIFVGPSGCGKTTALRMIAGLEEISAGDLLIDDEVVNDRAPKDRDIAMVFQNYALYPHMTVRDNMGFALRLASVDKQEIDRRVRKAAGILDLDEHLDRKPARLSGGQRQRVAMGRAIVRNPKAFLMDEPLSNLDAKLRVQMRAQVARLQSQLQTTTVYVTHDQTEAMTLGDRVAVMRDGLLQQVGTPQDLYDGPVNLFVAGFIGSPAMNFLTGQLNGRAVHTPIGTLALSNEVRAVVERAPSHGRDVVVGIRPEAFEDAGRPGGAGERHEFEAAVEITESVGSDLYAHFSPEAEPGTNVVTRLEPASTARPGNRHKFWLDTTKLQLFDAADGRSLTSSSE